MLRLLISLGLILLSCFCPWLYSQVSLDTLLMQYNDPTENDTVRFRALESIAIDVYWSKDLDSSIYYMQLMSDFAGEKGINTELAASERWLSTAYWYKGDYEKAFERGLNSLSLYEDLNDTLRTGLLNHLLGVIFSDQAEYSKALDYYDKALDVYEFYNDPQRIAMLMNNYSVIHARIGEFEESARYLTRAKNIADSMGDESLLATVLPNLALDHYQFKEYDKGLQIAQRGLEVSRKVGNSRQEAQSLGVIADYYVWIKDLNEALKYRKEALEVARETGASSTVADQMNLIGEIYHKKGGFNRAIDWCSQALQMFKASGYLEGQSDSYDCLYEAYKDMGQAELALLNHEKYKEVEDSIKEENTSKKLQQLEFKRQFVADSLSREKEKIELEYQYQADLQKKENTKNIFIASGFLLFLLSLGLYNRMRFARKAKNEIEKEKERSDNLLLNILPSEIAEELKIKGKSDAREFDQVSILFTDFKSFTGIAERMTSHELVEAIHICFKAFDHICEKYGIEKIKTIGDAYMAAGGLPVPTEEAARNTVLAALEMQEFIRTFREERTAVGKESFEMRAGVHTGPVVAGIVGVKKFQYDIWGDTVNIASRMESHGAEGKVNVSQYTYNIIKHDPALTFESRGDLHVKGKGEMHMYFVSKAIDH